MTGERDDDATLGFTWGETDDMVWLRSDDGQYKRVDSPFFETLRALAEGAKRPEDLSSKEATAVEHLREEGCLRTGEPVERMETPDPVALGPRLLAFALAFLSLTAYVVYRLFVSGTVVPTVVSAELGLLKQLLISLPAFVALALVHEAGHYLAARPYFETSMRFSLLNGVFPALVTETNDAWHCPRSVRVWINLAGPFVDCCQCLLLAAASLLLFPGSYLLAILPVFQYLRIVFSLNPLVRGDGYWMLVDWFGATNLHTRGLRDLKNRTASPQAIYAVASTVFTVLAASVMVFFLARLAGVVG